MDQGQAVHGEWVWENQVVISRPQPGDRVLILAGPLALREGEVRAVDGDLVTVVVEVLQRKVDVELNIKDIGPASSLDS